MMHNYISLARRCFVALPRRSQRGACNERGQALAELGIVIVLFMLLSLGIVEFGRMLMITNVITHAARDGARTAAVAQRDPNTGAILNSAAIVQQVEDQMSNVLDMGTVPAGSVVVDPPGFTSGIPTVTVRIQNLQIPYLFAGFLFPGGDAALTVNRVVTFRDERR